MSLSGNLEDVSVADLVQFIYLGGRTGTLELTHVTGAASIGFHRGRLISAFAPGEPRLGDRLVENGIVSEDTMQHALAQQAEETPRRSIGRLLVSMGALSEEALRTMVEKQIQEAVCIVIGWRHGTFRFRMDELRPIDDIGLYPGDVVANIELDTQFVLLEALRLFDERNEKASPRAPAGEVSARDLDHSILAVSDQAPTPAVGAAPKSQMPRLQMITQDGELVAQLVRALKGQRVRVVTAGLRDAGIPAPDEEPPFVLFDLRRGTLEQLERLCRSRSRSPVVAVLAPGDTTPAKVYQAGAVAVLPPDVDSIAACAVRLLLGRATLGARHATEGDHNLRRLRRIVGDLRSGLISATISLNLMSIIAESTERAVLFLVRDNALVVLGAFGNGPDARPLADALRATRHMLAKDSAMGACLADGQPRRLSFEEAKLPKSFADAVGRPRSSQVALFPVVGGQRVIALVYADNGRSQRAIEELDLLELAISQVGLAFENELLRRQIVTHR